MADQSQAAQALRWLNDMLTSRGWKIIKNCIGDFSWSQNSKFTRFCSKFSLLLKVLSPVQQVLNIFYYYFVPGKSNYDRHENFEQDRAEQAKIATAARKYTQKQGM